MDISIFIFFIGVLIILGYNMLKKDPNNEVTYLPTTNSVVDVLDPIEEANIEVENSIADEEDTLFKGVTKFPTFAIIFGNSSTNPATYGGSNKLSGVEADLRRVHALLKSYGKIKNSYNAELTRVTADTFDNAKSTSLEYQDAIKRVANFGKTINGKKLLFIYESGHGGQTYNAKDNDLDKLSETRCFYDKVVKDDDTRQFITKTLGSDWVVINIVDRCHSGGLARIVSEDTEGTIKSLGIVDRSLLYKFKSAPKANGKALLKIQSAAKEGTYAMDYGAINGGLFTWKYVTGIIENKGNISYEAANKYAETQCGTVQVPELQTALDQDHKDWSNENIFLT